MENLRDLLIKATATSDEKYCMVCTVLAVDKTAGTCDVTPLNGAADLVDIRLQAQAGSGLVVYPLVGSTVIVSFLNKDDGYVSMVSEVDAYTLKNQSDSLKTILADFLDQVANLKVTTNTGASINVINQPQILAIKNRLNTFFHA